MYALLMLLAVTCTHCYQHELCSPFPPCAFSVLSSSISFRHFALLYVFASAVSCCCLSVQNVYVCVSTFQKYVIAFLFVVVVLLFLGGSWCWLGITCNRAPQSCQGFTYMHIFFCIKYLCWCMDTVQMGQDKVGCQATRPNIPSTVPGWIFFL